VKRNVSCVHRIDEPASRIEIADLWVSADAKAWDAELARYWSFVKPENLELERSLNILDLERLRRLDARGWYDFLKREYFRWKYTAANRYASTTKHLRRYLDENALGDLDQIRSRLLTLDTNDIRSGLKTATEIYGLGTAGASGLLSLMYPQKFATVDQFVVRALGQVNGLPEAPALARMKPADLTIPNGVLIIDMLRRKATDNNRVLRSDAWTPRKLDMVLWTYGRPRGQR
jgi:hypothetical protein